MHAHTEIKHLHSNLFTLLGQKTTLPFRHTHTHTHAQLISRIVLFSPLRAKERDWQRNAHMYMYTRCHGDIYSMDVMNINCSLQRKWILNKKGCSFRPCLVRIHASQVSKLMASCTLLKTHTLTKPNYRVCGCAYTMPFDQERFLFFIHSVCKAV